MSYEGSYVCVGIVIGAILTNAVYLLMAWARETK